MSDGDAVPETSARYKARILGYQRGQDALVLQVAAPDRLAALVDGLSADELDRRPAPGKWCIREIAAHLADDELVGAYRIRLILSDPGTAIQAFDQAVWARTGRYAATDVNESVALFRALRQFNLALLRTLSDEEWDRHGLHAERGVESIRDIAAYYAGHDINHFKQIEAIKASSRPSRVRTFELVLVPGRLAICRLASQAPIPTELAAAPFLSITRTADELSIVCAEESAPATARREAGWRCLAVKGPLEFTQVGVLAALAVPLAEARIPIVAISTFDTDYLLVQEPRLADALVALRAAGHLVAE